MNWTEIVASILSTLGLQGLALVLARSWLKKRLDASIDHSYNTRLETLKADLNAQLQIELESQRRKNAIELEQIKNEAQKELEAYKAILDQGQGAFVLLWESLDKLVDKCASVRECYHEFFDETEKDLLKTSADTYTEAEACLRRVSIIVDPAVAREASGLLRECYEEIKSYRYCLGIKSARYGSPPDPGRAMPDYDIEEAYKATRDRVREIFRRWEMIQGMLRFDMNRKERTS